MKIRIAISGKMASGKTTTANYLISRFGCGKVYSLATPLKEMEKLHVEYKSDRLLKTDLINAIKEYIDKFSVAEEDKQSTLNEIIDLYDTLDPVVPKNRVFLQRLGTDILRKKDDAIFVNYLINSCKDEHVVIVDDVRFINEAEKLKEAGFKIIRLEPNENLRRKIVVKIYGEDAISPEKLAHRSETDLDGQNHLFDAVIKHHYLISSLEETFDIVKRLL